MSRWSKSIDILRGECRYRALEWENACKWPIRQCIRCQSTQTNEQTSGRQKGMVRRWGDREIIDSFLKGIEGSEGIGEWIQKWGWCSISITSSKYHSTTLLLCAENGEGGEYEISSSIRSYRNPLQTCHWMILDFLPLDMVGLKAKVHLPYPSLPYLFFLEGSSSRWSWCSSLFISIMEGSGTHSFKGISFGLIDNDNDLHIRDIFISISNQPIWLLITTREFFNWLILEMLRNSLKVKSRIRIRLFGCLNELWIR